MSYQLSAISFQIGASGKEQRWEKIYTHKREKILFAFMLGLISSFILHPSALPNYGPLEINGK